MMKRGKDSLPKACKSVVIGHASDHIFRGIDAIKKRNGSEEAPNAKEFEKHKLHRPHRNDHELTGSQFLPTAVQIVAVKIDKVQRGVKNHGPEDGPEDVLHCVFEGDHLDRTCDLRCKSVESDDGSCNVEGNVEDVCEEDEE